MNYISIKQAASKWGVGVRQVQNYCKNSEVEGVIRFNGVWAIPFDAQRPVDGRRRAMETAPLDPAGGTALSADELALFKGMVDEFPYRINITDINGYMVYANNAFFEGTLLGVKEAALGRYNIFQEERLAKWGLTEHLRKAFRGEHVYTPCLRFPNKDFIGSKYGGEYAFFSLYNDVVSFPMFAEDGQLRYVVTTFIPVREYMARDEVMQAREYIEAHWLDTFSTKRAAQEVHMSVSSFVQAFRNETGMTPHEYCTQVRMTRLREILIKNNNLSIAHAFHICGMDYNSYYAALFKRHMGLTPKQFREQNK